MGFAWRQGTKVVRCSNFNNTILQDEKKKKNGHPVTTEIGWYPFNTSLSNYRLKRARLINKGRRYGY